MKKSFIAFAIVAAAAVAGCSSGIRQSAPVSDDPFALITIDEVSAETEKPISLRDMTGELEMIQLEDIDEALVKSWKLAVSNGYILVIQSGGMPVKLFDRSGKYIADVGGVGEGPGEYMFIYDGLIDEENNRIYLSQYTGGILSYDLNGRFAGKVDLPVGSKPVLAKTAGGGLSAVSISFSDADGTPVASSVDRDGRLSVAAYPALQTMLRDRSGAAVGLNGEVFGYRCVGNNVFLNTAVDTMYVYDAESGRIYPRSVLNLSSPKQDGEFIMSAELPAGIMMSVIGRDMKHFWYDKTTGKVSRSKIINDYLGDNAVGYMLFRDGYYVECIDPGVLMDRIEEKWSPDPDLPDERKQRLREMMANLDPDRNNIVFLAPLRRD